MSKKVLVIGGGYGGLCTCSGLRKKNKDVEITLVEPKDYFEFFWAAFRTPFDETKAKDSLLPLEPFVQKWNIKHIKSLVSKLEDEQATLANGDVIPFDVCVVATGAACPWETLGRGPESVRTVEERLAILQKSGEDVLGSSSVVIVGGGLIGSELAGDVAYFGKDKVKSVTLVQSKDRLCLEMKPPASAMVKKKLEKLGVKVILNDRVKTTDDGKCALESSGEVIEADKVIYTTGISSVSKSFMDPKYLDEKGWIVADEFLRVKGSNNKIFAIGDCCNMLMNQGAVMMGNVAIMGHNIDITLSGGEDKKLKKAKDGPGMFLCTVGGKGGVAGTPMFHTQFFLPGLKNKTMFFFTKGDIGF